MHVSMRHVLLLVRGATCHVERAAKGTPLRQHVCCHRRCTLLLIGALTDGSIARPFSLSAFAWPSMSVGEPKRTAGRRSALPLPRCFAKHSGRAAASDPAAQQPG